MLTRGIVALTATAVSAALLTAGQAGAASPAATPPYESSSNAAGTLTFYNSSGAVITSGSTNSGPFAAYAVGSASPRAGDTQAVVVFANPDPKSDAYAWYAHQAGAFSTYPATSAPTAVSSQDATHPVYTGTSSDLTLDEFESGATQYTSSGYLNMVQVRLQTANSASQVTTNYDDADLLINPSTHTWTEVYPSGGATPPPTPDRTSLAIGSPASVKYGASAKVTGTLKDTTKNRALSGQSVSLYERSSSKASAKLVKKVKSGSNGSLSTTVKLTAGEQFQWRYAATSSYQASSSSYKSVAVTTSVALSVDHSTIKHGQTATFYGSTTPATSGIHVELQQLVGKKWKNVASAVQKRQKLPNKKTSVAFRIAHKFAKKGTYKFRVSKAATSALRGSVSRTITEHVK